MRKLIAALVLSLNALAILLVAPAQAQQNPQDTVWIQVAARPTLASANQEAQAFAAKIPDVAGFSLGGGWYGVLIGPYTREDANRVLQVYRAEGQIPRDSFIALPNNLRNQFYPLGEDAAQANQPAQAPEAVASAEGGETAQQLATPETVVIAEPAAPALPDETRAEARRSEQRLSRDERKDLQIALKAAGFYSSAIDGAFGRGTRRSMSDWQTAKGFEVTGVLTTAQRQILLDDYNAPLISVGMRRITDSQAGISLEIPAGEVAFNRYEPPFAHYDSSSDLGVRVLLISQRGDKSTLYGLYDIMQTLEIVPLDGPRERKDKSFTLEGRNSRFVSFTQASLKNGEIKGFTLIWPANDEARRTRVLAAMQASFERADGVLDDAAGADIQQDIDLLSGLEIRKPKMSRSGFFVSSDGVVVTTADVVQGCTRVTLDHGYPADILASDSQSGMAILRPTQSLAPMAVAEFSPQSPRLQSEIAVSGFSYEGVLGAPSLTWGKLADVKSLEGDSTVARLALTAQPGDAGGPVVDASGAVLGMLLPQGTQGRQLPADVSFAANAEAIRSALEAVGLEVQSHPSGTPLPNQALVNRATGMTVLVSCWK
ncbi:trypsin-like peptidase domain-containing protein [Pseudophaeobacter sp. EL27]|uniref:trypsin-like peptidase domain-containing protein n=1 Tax=Pseudophaeobacter sp. EL27 TaxID=2107580 RepID=UPI000EFAF412|nr:trypsin-like peptidase domain-containing protein [Pseudophaeobacter sp. EL27]